MLRPLVLLALVAASRALTECCPDIGCFTDDPPFDGLPLPWCVSAMVPLTYTMYTQTNPIVGEQFDHNSAIPLVFNPLRRTVFIVHGYQNNGGMPWLDDMKDVFLNREDINVVVVDWSGGADILNYNQAASNTRSAGAYTALVMEALVTRGGGDHSRMWCAGHSLGSHHCGHAGMHSTQTIGRITGMDPAGPSFESSPDLSIGLNPSCAAFVDVLHTNNGFYGTLRALGHIDFYPAGGDDQPGCGIGESVCSHMMATTYLEESIRSDCFATRSQCDNYNFIPSSCTACTCAVGTEPCAYMGYAADTSCQQTGIYHLDVGSVRPYCLG